MNTSKVSAIGGPMSLIVSGCLGESGFGNSSHFSRYAQQQYLARHCRAYKRWCPRVLSYLLGMWFAEQCPDGGRGCVLIEIIHSSGFWAI